MPTNNLFQMASAGMLGVLGGIVYLFWKQGMPEKLILAFICVGGVWIALEKSKGIVEARKQPPTDPPATP